VERSSEESEQQLLFWKFYGTIYLVQKNIKALKASLH